MIARFAKVVTDFFLFHGVIRPDEIEIYQYGNEIIISSFLDFLIVFVLGLVFNKIICAFLFFLAFILLRSFSGGYHAETYMKCKIIFMINLSIVLYVLLYAEDIYRPYMLVILLLFSLIVVWRLSPIENENKPLSNEEVLMNAKRSKYIIVLQGVIILITYRINKDISLSLLLSIFSVAVGMIIEYFIKGGTVYEDSKDNSN